MTYRAAPLVLFVEGLLVVGVLVVVVAGTQLPDSLIAFRLAPASVLILGLWIVGPVLVSRAHRVLVTLVGGVLLERAGDAIADGLGLSGVLFGATMSRCGRAMTSSR